MLPLHRGALHPSIPLAAKNIQSFATFSTSKSHPAHDNTPPKSVTMPEPCRILVMASGNGTNFQALIDAIASNTIPNSKITRLIVNRAKAYATTRAEKANIPWEYFNLIGGGFLPKGEKNEQVVAAAREKYDAALAQKVLSLGEDERPELIVLAGWMYVFSGEFLRPLEKEGIRIINLHPALPGEFALLSLFFAYRGFILGFQILES